jgi:hypothetical protein
LRKSTGAQQAKGVFRGRHLAKPPQVNDKCGFSLGNRVLWRERYRTLSNRREAKGSVVTKPVCASGSERRGQFCSQRSEYCRGRDRDGVNMILDYWSADGRAERLPQLAAELVRASPDLLIAGFGTLAPKAAIAATSSIPIVFTSVGDPVGAGLIASLSQPGANATGLSAQASDITAKRLQLLKDLIPGKKLIAVLGNPDTPYTALALQQVRTAGAVMGQLLAVFEARTVDQLPTAIHEAIIPARDVAHRDGDGLFLADQYNQPLPTCDAGVEKVPLQHGVVLRHDRDDYGGVFRALGFMNRGGIGGHQGIEFAEAIGD